jgi:hypothetical protein
MSCLLLNTSGDLDTSTGRLVVVKDEATITAQKLNALFQFFQGEWYEDTRLGVPYFQFLFVPSPNLPLIGGILRQVIMSAPGVAQISSANITFDKSSRTLSATFTIVTNRNAVLVGGPGVPFIIKSNGASS